MCRFSYASVPLYQANFQAYVQMRMADMPTDGRRLPASQMGAPPEDDAFNTVIQWLHSRYAYTR